MTRKLFILGAGGHGTVVADTAEKTQQWQSIYFLDDRYPALNTLYSWGVKGKFSDFVQFIMSEVDFIVAVGDNAARMDWCEKIIRAGANLVSVIHPGAYISKYSHIGRGSVCFAGAIVNINVRIGNGCIINSGACVEHDCVLAESVHICPNAALAGGVEVGKYSTIGINSSIKQLVTIGENVTIGAGSVVIKNIPSRCTAFGIPAKPRLISQKNK